jgi:predicted nucleic acid-binding protein
MGTHFTALFDACVLYPAPLRDLLLQLATTGLFRAKWSDLIHEEWIEAVLAQRKDLKREQLERTRQLMDAHAYDSLVTGYEALISGLTMPDADDRHVLAAAIRGRAEVIVTFNLKHFPSTVLEPYEIEVQHPDEFIGNLADLMPQAVCAAARTCRARLKKPTKTVEEYLAKLTGQQLPVTVSFLNENRRLL